jgi:hypothetical protein
MAGQTTESELSRYLAARGIIEPGDPPERWYADNWLYYRIGSWRVPFFPLMGLREPTLLHDLNHLLSGCDTTWAGEFEIASWELASGGCSRFAFFWADRLIFVLLGLLLAPLPTIRGFRGGRGHRNAYCLDPACVLKLPFTEVQRIARVANGAA